jgi:xanthine/uracil permease
MSRFGSSFFQVRRPDISNHASLQDDLAKSIQTIFFVSGINTLLQTSFGTRLPTVIGGSFSFLTPVLIIASNFQNVEVDVS